MLPSPASHYQHRSRGDVFRLSRQRLRSLLLSRSRLTNLGVFLLAALCIVSLLFNFATYFSPRVYFLSRNGVATTGIMATIARDSDFGNLNHLIMVPGHAIWTGRDPDLRRNEDQWILEPYQKGGGRVETFFAHISEGSKLARDDPLSLLIFSGGQTRASSTSTEAESYHRLAVSANLLEDSALLHRRATTENHALDSFQNLLFSIARFREYTGRFPDKITVVGYEFKRARFVNLHRVALRWPERNFHYVGIDPTSSGSGHDPELGEYQHGYLPYSLDLYGCHSTLLAKRRQRNVHTRFHSYYTTCPDLQPLLDWCPSTTLDVQKSLFPGALPWDPQ